MTHREFILHVLRTQRERIVDPAAERAWIERVKAEKAKKKNA